MFSSERTWKAVETNVPCTGWPPGSGQIWDGLYFACGGGGEVNDPSFHSVYDAT